MKTIRAGLLNRQVKIQQLTQIKDEIGQIIGTDWADVATVWANIRHLSGTEAIKADAPTSTVRASIRIRYRAGIDAGMRVLHGSTAYDIQAVLPDEIGRRHIDLVCEVVS